MKNGVRACLSFCLVRIQRQSIINRGKTLQLEVRQGCLLPLLLFNRVLEALAGVIQQEKQIKGLQIRKEVELFPFVNDVIVNIKYPQNSTRKLSGMLKSST